MRQRASTPQVCGLAGTVTIRFTRVGFGQTTDVLVPKMSVAELIRTQLSGSGDRLYIPRRVVA